MAFQAEGKLHKVFDEEQKSDNFKAREFVVETDEKYPQFIKFQLVQDKCSLIDGHREGDQVNVSFDLRGREWNGKYFTNLQAWKIETADGSGSGSSGGSASGSASGSAGGSASSANPAAAQPATSGNVPQADFDDDIPF